MVGVGRRKSKEETSDSQEQQGRNGQSAFLGPAEPSCSSCHAPFTRPYHVSGQDEERAEKLGNSNRKGQGGKEGHVGKSTGEWNPQV